MAARVARDQLVYCRTEDLLSVKKETKEEDSDYHTLTLPVQ